MIDSISLKNYGNHHSVDWCSLGSINLIIGANGRGKSFILKAIYTAMKTIEACGDSHDLSRGSRQPIYREEPGSEIIFGPFDPAYYYDIEGSTDAKISSAGKLKSVEFVVARGNKLLFIEAKKTAPRNLSGKKAVKRLSEMIRDRDHDEYEKIIPSLSIAPSYIADVCEKFVMSLCLVMSIAEGRIHSDDMLPSMITAIRNPSVTPVFILVITWSEADWAKDVQAAFSMVLRRFEKTNRAQVLVLTAEQAKSRGLVNAYTPKPVEAAT